MREVGAACRMMLETAAAKRWGVDVSAVQAVDHEVVNSQTGQKFGYGELAADAAALPTPALDALTFKDAERPIATSAAAMSASSTCSTSPPAAPATAPTIGCPGRNTR